MLQGQTTDLRFALNETETEWREKSCAHFITEHRLRIRDFIPRRISH